MKNDLINKYYPIRDIETGDVIGVRSIKKAYDLENIAGYAISLSSNESAGLIIISHLEAVNLIEKNEYQNLSVFD